MPGTSQYRAWVDVVPTVDTSAYAAGDLIFTATLVPGVGPSVISNPEPVKLQTIIVQDVDDEAAMDLSLLFFRASTTLGTINNAFNPSDTVMGECVGQFDISNQDWLDYGGGKIAVFHGVNMIMQPVMVTTAGASLYVAGYTVGGSPTYTAATDLKLRFGFE